MKKACLIFVFLLFLVPVLCADDMFSEDRYYYDETTGYEGWASLMPLGTEAEAEENGFSFDQLLEELKEEMETEATVTDCLKLSKKESFLVFSALKDFDCEDGESYMLILSDEPSDVAQKSLGLIVTVIDAEKNFKWKGFYLIEAESENLIGFEDDDLKHYYNKKTGLEGWANIEFMGMNSELEKQGVDFVQIIGSVKEEALKAGEPVITDCNELSELESFLVWSALNEYDYEEDETYVVGITTKEPETADSGLFLFVIVTDGGENFYWNGFYFSEN